MNYSLLNHIAFQHELCKLLKRCRCTIRAIVTVICSALALSACQGTSDNERPIAIAYQTNQHLLQADHITQTLQPSQLTAAFVQTGISRKGDSTWLATISDDFARAKKRVEAELNIDLRTISLDVVDDISINAEVAHETKQLIEEQFGSSRFSEGFLQQIMHPLSGTYAALYSSRLKTVMISRSMLANYEGSLSEKHRKHKDAALMTLLVHELVHAADDLKYNIQDNRVLSFRASFAQSAIFEGHAQWVTRKICQYAGCSEGLNALDNFMFASQSQNSLLTQPVEAVSRSVLEYSYIEGELFIDALAKRAQGDHLIAELLQNPPLDPIQILAPETYPDIARKERNHQLIEASLDIDHQWGKPPWIGVETSPLKGVDLQSDPARRQSAIDGFTKLIKGMVSLQFYDQRRVGATPIEATVLYAESSHTANLFGSVLHSNTQQARSQENDERIRISTQQNADQQPLDIHIRRTSIDANIHYRSIVAVAGNYVVQVSGNTQEDKLLDDYTIQVLVKLNTSPTVQQE